MATAFPSSTDTIKRPQTNGPYLNPFHGRRHEDLADSIEAIESEVLTNTVNKKFNDNVMLLFGTGSDSSVYYDGTDLIINPKEVGSGVAKFIGNGVTLTAASGTSNQHLKVENTTDAGASHSIVDIAVGGSTSTGDPQLRFTVPSGTSWVLGVDNSVDDVVALVKGTLVNAGSASFFVVDGRVSGGAATITQVRVGTSGSALTLDDGAEADGVLFQVARGTQTIRLLGTTQVTSLMAAVRIGESTSYSASGGAVTIDKATMMAITPVKPSHADVTLTEGSAIRILNSSAATGTFTTLAGILIEGLTRGTNDYQILFKNGGQEPGQPADAFGLYAVDIAAGRATLGLALEESVAVEAATASTHTLSVRINGATYRIMLTNA